MRPLITIFLCLIAHSLLSQSSYVYKRNPATGTLEVFQSSGGLPTGSPIYKIKRNVYGYLEVENVDVLTNPFTRKPDYNAYNNFKPYQLPAKEIFQTLEVLNKRAEVDYVMSQPQNNNPEYQKVVQAFRENLKAESALATSYLNFYNSNVSFPKSLKNGWYEVVNIYDNRSLGKTLNVAIDYSYYIGICKVENNKIAEYYKNCHAFNFKEGYVFQKEKIDVSSGIASCKATFRKASSTDYTTIYFLDNILDSTKQIDNPNFSFYSIYTSPNFKFHKQNSFVSIQIIRNKTITRDEVQNFAAGIYSTAMIDVNPQTNDCRNSMLTMAFRKTKDPNDKFSLGIYREEDKFVWLLNNLSFTPGDCNSTILNDK